MNGTVGADQSNELLEYLEKFGSHDIQYAVLLSTLIGFSKVAMISKAQVKLDVNANWSRVPKPRIIKEH